PTLGKRHGLLTEGLVVLLEELGDEPVTWSGLLSPLLRRVLDAAAAQRPEVEGRSGRLLFSLDERETTGVYPVLVNPDGAPRIDIPRVLGPEVGDVFNICRSGSASADVIGTGEVVEVTALSAMLHLELPAGTVLPPD